MQKRLFKRLEKDKTYEKREKKLHGREKQKSTMIRPKFIRTNQADYLSRRYV